MSWNWREGGAQEPENGRNAKGMGGEEKRNNVLMEGKDEMGRGEGGTCWMGEKQREGGAGPERSTGAAAIASPHGRPLPILLLGSRASPVLDICPGGGCRCAVVHPNIQKLLFGRGGRRGGSGRRGGGTVVADGVVGGQKFDECDGVEGVP